MNRALKLILMLLLLLPSSVVAQTIVSGSVTDSVTGQAVRGVIVKVVSNGTASAYGISNNDGRFELKVNSKEAELMLTFEHVTYDVLRKMVPNKTQTVNVSLSEKSFDLVEVTVSPPKLRQRGDTLSYQLAAFTGVADVSLEDAMKNLPGVTISTTGAIQYQGKDINNFYIEGLDMLGGKYGIATKGIPATAVSVVEVIENHQSIKQLRNRVHSDNVAINVKLNQKAKLKPFGTAQAQVGYGEEGFLYRLALTGMLFSPKFQTISSAKIGNFGALGSAETISHFDAGGDIASKPFSVLADIGLSTPPLNENRYQSVQDRMVSINTINKFSKDDVLKVNLDYTNTITDYSYGTISNYYTDQDNVVVTEDLSSNTRTHKPSVTLEYSLNDSTVYIRNRLLATGSFERSAYLTHNNLDQIGQDRDATMVDVRNYFDFSKRVEEQLWSFSSLIDYTMTPTNKMIFSGVPNAEGDFYQTATGNTFFTKEDFSFSFKFGNYFRLYTPLSLQFAYDELNTNLAKNQTEASNNIRGIQFTPSFSPQLEFATLNNRFTLRLNLPVRYFLLNYDTQKFRFSKVTFDPNIYLDYAVSSSVKLLLTAGMTNNVGDLLDLLTMPVQVNYRTRNVKSGILAQNRTGSASLKIEYKRPLDFLFINAQIGYSNLKHNLLTMQLIDGENITNSSILADNNSENINAVVSVTKHFQPIKTKITVGGSYLFGRGDIMQQGVITGYDQQTFSFFAGVVARPWRWIELDYSINLSWNTNKFSDVRESFSSEAHLAKLSFFPIPKLQLYSQLEYVRNEVAQSVFKNMALFDAGVSYKLKSIKLGIAVNNLLDSKQYAYTMFNGLDNFSYSYPLRGREYMFSIIFM